MFKKFFDKMMNATTENEIYEIFHEADIAFQKEKISWKDQQRLLNLATRLSKTL